MQPEDERRDAVGEPYGDDPERPAGVEREPHQRDVVQRVTELAGGDREEEPAEVAAPEQVQRLGRGRCGAGLELAGDVEDRIGHLELSLPGEPPRGLMWVGVLAGMAQTKQVARVGRRA